MSARTQGTPPDTDQTRQNQNPGTRGTPTTGAARNRTDATASQSARSHMRSDRQREVPMTRESGRRSTQITTPRRSTAPTVFSVPPGALASTFLANPFEFMNRISDEMNQWFDVFAPDTMPLTTPALSQGTQRGVQNMQGMWMPQIDTVQRNNQLVIRADLPGVKKEDLDVHVENGMLVISGERNQEEEENREGMYRSERDYGSFYRAITLPEGIDENQISAHTRDGVLEVTIPMPKQAEQQQRRKIEVK